MRLTTCSPFTNIAYLFFFLPPPAPSPWTRQSPFPQFPQYFISLFRRHRDLAPWDYEEQFLIPGFSPDPPPPPPPPPPPFPYLTLRGSQVADRTLYNPGYNMWLFFSQWLFQFSASDCLLPLLVTPEHFLPSCGFTGTVKPPWWS